MTEKPYIIGIFGPPGSGKSTLLSFFAEKGIAVWSADDAVKRLYMAGSPGSKRISEYFGKQFLAQDGSVSNSRLARTVLAFPLKLKILEHLIHPLVINEAVHWIDEQKKLGNQMLAMEASVFDTNGLGRYTDMLVKVDADIEICRERVLARGKTDAYFNALYSVTRTYDTPYVIENSGSMVDFKNSFEKLFSTITISA